MIDNPYCAVITAIMSDDSGEGRATELDSRSIVCDGNRVLYIDVKENGYGKFFSIRERKAGSSSKIIIPLEEIMRVHKAIGLLANKHLKV